MVTSETHQSQDLMVPCQNQDEMDQQDEQEESIASPSSPLAGFDPEKMSQGPVNAITVLTLLDKLVNMLDTGSDVAPIIVSFRMITCSSYPQ